MSFTREQLISWGVSPSTLDAAAGERPAKVKRRGRQNKTEKRFADEYLESLKRNGIIEGYAFEPIKLLIAAPGPDTKGAWFTPDFLAWMGTRTTVYEVKGFWRTPARLRMKVAAERFPFMRFIAVRAEKKAWRMETFGEGG